jgi:acyl-CoA thioester hydrolase
VKEQIQGSSPSGREDYALHVRLVTRWNDYDMLGHVNNVEYYRYFETAILTLLRETGLDWQLDPVIPLAAENGCSFLKPVAVSGHVDIGVRIAHLGNSSVRYETAVFEPDNDTPSASGFFVHVFIDRATGRPVAMPQLVRAHFEQQCETLAKGQVRLVDEAQLLPTRPPAGG